MKNVGFRNRRFGTLTNPRIMIPAILVIAVLMIILSVVIPYNTRDSMVTTVTEKQRMCNSTSEGQDCKWMVFTKDQEFENTDTILFMKWNSTTLQRKLEIGKTYKIEYYGHRVGFLSSYPNIVGVKEVDPKAVNH